MKNQRHDTIASKDDKYLRVNALKAVSFKKGKSSWLMPVEDYANQLTEQVPCSQFQKVDETNEDKLSIESAFNRRLMSMVRDGKLAQERYKRGK